jgi:hypothetical protein
MSGQLAAVCGVSARSLLQGRTSSPVLSSSGSGFVSPGSHRSNVAPAAWRGHALGGGGRRNTTRSVSSVPGGRTAPEKSENGRGGCSLLPGGQLGSLPGAVIVDV